MFRRNEDDIAATSAVTAIGTAEFDKGFAAHRHRAVAALSGTNDNINLVYERLGLH